MKKLFLVMILLALSQAALALKIKSLNEAEIPVTAQSDQQREQAIQQAFIQTLSKMSGSVDILKNPEIKAAVPHAKNQVEEFGYVPSGVPATPYYLKVQFDAKAMRRLLRRAGAPIWDENRPLILIWLTVPNAAHTAEILDSQSTNDIVQLLKKSADHKGLPILMPMMDISELDKLSADDIRAAKVDESLQKASQRYHCDGMLIGGIEQNGQMLDGHWKLILDDDEWDWNFTSNTPSGLIDLLTNKMVSTLAGRYAAVQTENTSSAFILVIKGVSQHDDFENLMHFMKHISLIKQMEIENISGDSVILHVDVQGAQMAFKQDASVGQHLKLESEDGNNLTYNWTP